MRITMTLKRIIKGILPYGFVVGIYPKIYHNIITSALDIKKYKGYRPAGGMGDKLSVYIDYVKKGTNLKVENVFEIGANFAQDADYLMEQFCLKPNNIYVFEAHPEIYNAIKEIHQFNAYNYAVFNETKKIEFNIFPLDFINTGMSSIYEKWTEKWGGGKKITVQAIRMDEFLAGEKISNIDFLKIDVEGATYQVLEGFGSYIKNIKCIQLEAEHGTSAITDYNKIHQLLVSNNYELVHFYRHNESYLSDSFWVQKEWMKIH